MFSARRSRVPPHDVGERDGVRRAHLQVIWLLLSGEAASAVARVSGFSRRWIEKLVVRWNSEGPAGLGQARPASGGGQHASLQMALSLRLRAAGQRHGRVVARQQRQ